MTEQQDIVFAPIAELLMRLWAGWLPCEPGFVGMSHGVYSIMMWRAADD